MKSVRRIERRINMAAALRGFITRSMTVAEVARECSVSRPSAESILADLDELGWLTRREPGESSRGRPAATYSLAASAGHVLSVDIGARHIRIICADLGGGVLVEKALEVSPEIDGDARIRMAVEASRAVRADTDPGPLLSCTVGSPGVVKDGIVRFFGGDDMPRWQGCDVGGPFRDALGAAVHVVGDCQLGALGNAWLGAASGYSDVVYILAGVRTGAACVVDGHVRTGHSGSSGLIGELEALRWRELEREQFAVGEYGEEHPRREAIFAAAREGDERAIRAVGEYAHVLALGAAAMVLTLDPQCVVVGGAFASQADLFLPRLRDELEHICPFPPQVVASDLGVREVALGGVRHSLDSVARVLTETALESDYFPSPGELRESVLRRL